MLLLFTPRQHFACYIALHALHNCLCCCFIPPFPTLPHPVHHLFQVQVKVDMTRAHGPSFLFELVKCGAVRPDEKVLQAGASGHRSHVERPAQVRGWGTPYCLQCTCMCPAPVPLQSAAEKGGRRGGQGKSRVPSGSTVEEECRQTEDASSLYSLCVRLQATSLQA